jgi:hypothetical protein
MQRQINLHSTNGVYGLGRMTEDQVRQTLQHLRVEDMLFKDTPLPVHGVFSVGRKDLARTWPAWRRRVCPPCSLACVLLAGLRVGLRVGITFASVACLVFSWHAWQAM